jgi:two-component system response regulator HydG
MGYLTKPLDIGELRTMVDKATQTQRLPRTNLDLQRQLNERFGFEGVVGNSPAMHAVVQRLRQIAPTVATVLITGESGTGKELVAKAIHNNSPRRTKPFVPLNCAALSENILESELFGHIKGAFTGADRERKGWFEHANGGTALPRRDRRHPAVDPGEAAPRPGVGGDRPGRHERADQGQRPARLGHESRPHRGDRLGLVPPGPLPSPQGRERQAPAAPDRREDIPLLIDYFLKDFSAAHGKPLPTISPPPARP